MKRILFPLLLIIPFICLPAQSPADFYEKVAAATVYIKHEVFMDPALCRDVGLFKRWEERRSSKLLSSHVALASGSGFLVGDEGLILTNRHVAENDGLPEIRTRTANAIAASLVGDATKDFSAVEVKRLKLDIFAMITKGAYRFSVTVGKQVVTEIWTIAVAGKDAPDIAVLKVALEGKKGLHLAQSDALGQKFVGQDVFSFGFPLGSSMESSFKDLVVTMNKGTVSALRKDPLGIQHTAAISKGNSGGPLVDQSGTVVGMNTALLEEGNSLFFAVGVDRIREFLAAKAISLPEPAPAGAIAQGPASVTPVPAVVPATVPATAGVAAKPSGLVTNADGEVEVSASVFVESEEGAEILLAGRKVGVAPMFVTLTEALTPITVSGSGGKFHALLRLSPELRGSTVVKAALNPVGALFIASNTDSARVRVDGIDLGDFGTGVFHDLAAGDCLVELVGEDLYGSLIVRIEPGTITQARLSVGPVGSIGIVAPENAKTVISGPDWSMTVSGSADLGNIPAGEVALKTEAADFPAAETKVVLGQGKKSTWKPYSAGILTFSVTPADSACELTNGTVIQTRGAAESMEPGTYQAILRRPGYLDSSVAFTVTAGKRTVVAANLTELKRGTIVLPRFGSPLDILVEGTRFKGKDGPENTVIYEGIPAGYTLTLAFDSPAGLKTDIPERRLALAEGETARLDLPSGRISMPWVPAGASVLIGKQALVVLKDEAELGFLSQPLPPGTYELEIRGGPEGTDISLTAIVKSDMSSEPEGYKARLIERLITARSKVATDISLFHKKNLGSYISIGTGVVGTVGAVAVYFIGKQVMDDYRAATDSTSAVALHKDLEVLNIALLVSAGLGGSGLGLSAFIWPDGKKAAAMKRAMTSLDEGLEVLQ